MIVHQIVELDHAHQEGPPVFDIEVPPFAPGIPAPVRHVYCRVERGEIVGPRQNVKLFSCVVFACNPELPPEKRRLALLAPTGRIPDELASQHAYLGTYLHPANGMPISVYEFPWSPMEDETAVDEATPDPLAAINAVRDSQAADGEVPA